MVEFDLVPLLQDQTRIAKVKSAYNLLIIAPRGLQCETNFYEIMGWESFDVVRFDLGTLLQGQMRTAKLKSAYNLLIMSTPLSGVRTLGFRSFEGKVFILSLPNLVWVFIG